MKTQGFFFQPVDKRNRQAMVDFLSQHFRYDTMHSWNRSTSYAQCVKIHRLGIPNELLTTAYELLVVDVVQKRLTDLMRDWSKRSAYRWQAGFNGRAGGYVVLYQGGQKPSAYRSYCPECGQRHVKLVSPTSSCCGRCGADRVNYRTPPIEVFTQPSMGIDEDRDFDTWRVDDLRERVELVQSFDRLCDTLRHAYLAMCAKYEVIDKQIMVPHTVKVLVPRTA